TGGLALGGAGQGRDAVLARRGVQQVGGQLAVPDDGAAPAPGLHRRGIERGCVEYFQPEGGVVQQAGQVGVLQRADQPVLDGVPVGRPVDDDPVALFAVDGGPGGQQPQPGGGVGQRTHLRLGQGGGRLGLALGRQDVLQPQPGDHGPDLQVQQQADGGGLVAFAGAVGPGGRLDRCVGAYGAEGIAELGVSLVFLQVGPLAGLDGGVVQMIVNAGQAAELLDQGQGGLFADALDPRDVVRGVALQAFDVDQLPGRQAVFFLHGRLVHHTGLAVAPRGGGQQDGGVGADELQVVPVAGGKVAGFPALVAGGGQGAQDVVGLPPFGGDQFVSQVGQKLPQQGHLGSEFIRHAVPVGFVAIVHFVAERRSRQVKGNGDLVWLI